VRFISLFPVGRDQWLAPGIIAQRTSFDQFNAAWKKRQANGEGFLPPRPGYGHFPRAFAETVSDHPRLPGGYGVRAMILHKFAILIINPAVL
jgi:hypothetical protein